MTDFTIPPSPPRATDGSNWPRHRSKARSKTHRRREVIVALPQEDDHGTSYSQ